MPKRVELITSVNLEDRKYTGRFLGFIKDDEFNAMCDSKACAAKIESKETESLMDVCLDRSGDKDLSGLRIVLATKEIDGKTAKAKSLFISEKLKNIGFFETQSRRVTFLTKSNKRITMQEIIHDE